VEQISAPDLGTQRAFCHGRPLTPLPSLAPPNREDGAIAFWKLRVEGDVVFTVDFETMTGHASKVTTLLALDGSRSDGRFDSGVLVSGGVDAGGRVWDPTKMDNKCVQRLHGHTGTITCMTQAGPCLVTGSTDGTYRLWGPGKKPPGRAAARYPCFDLKRTLGHSPGWITAVCFDATTDVGDVGTVYAGDSTGAFSCFKPRLDKSKPGGMDFSADENRGRVPFKPVLGERGVVSMLYIAEEKTVFALTYDNCFRVYDVGPARHGTCLHVVRNKTRDVFRAMRYDAKKRQVFVVDEAGALMVWNVPSEHVVYDAHVTGVCVTAEDDVKLGANIPAVDLALWPGGDDVLVATPAGAIKAVKVTRESDYRTIKGGHGGMHHGEVIALDVGVVDDAERVFSASLDYTIRQWDTWDLACVRTFEEPPPPRGERAEIACMTYAGVSKKIVTGMTDGSLRVWGVESGQSVRLFDEKLAHDDSISCCCVMEGGGSKLNEICATGGFDGRVVIWNVKHTRYSAPGFLKSWNAHEGDLKEILAMVAFEADDLVDGIAAAAAEDDRVDAAAAAGDDDADDAADETAGGATPIERQDNGSELVTAGNDGIVRVWRAPNDLMASFIGHDEAVTSLALSSDARTLFSGGEDASIRVWNLAAVVNASLTAEAGTRPDTSDDLIAVLKGHDGAVIAMRTLTSGHLLSISTEGELLVWTPDWSGATYSSFRHQDGFRSLVVRENVNRALIGTTSGAIISIEALPAEGGRVHREMPTEEEDEETAAAAAAAAAAALDVVDAEESAEAAKADEDEIEDVDAEFERLGGTVENDAEDD
jgi:WD40 repeat protein